MKNQVRPIYSELQGYMSQAPELHRACYDAVLWNQINSTIDELNSVTGSDFNKFKIKDIKQGQNGPHIRSDEYRLKLSGLISRIHGTYFADEPPPFSGAASTIISTHQSQIQVTHVQFLLELQSTIDKRISGFEIGTKERTFLEKVKSALPNIGSMASLMQTVLSIARDIGLTVAEVLALLF